MTELQIKLQTQTQLLNVIQAKEQELQNLRQSLKAVKIDIFNINEGKQGELDL